MKRLIFLLYLFLSATFLYAQQGTISGKVTDKSGGLPGVSVSVKGTAIGVITDAKGNYTIQASNQATLVFSFIGFKSQEIPVNNRSSIDLRMDEEIVGLGEVVVVGYGTQRKIDVTGSVVQVKGADISNQASVNPISALQGKVAGVQITNEGTPGSSPEIRIRGMGTIYGNPNPLYVVDGVWFDDISFLNPGDIENINILKDASSEAIYGIRAANGVVIIETKKGIAGKTVVTYNGSEGYQKVTNQIAMANANQYATMIDELYGTPVLDPTKYGKGTDWYHKVLRDANVTNHQITVSGGTEKTTFNLSLGYLDQQGIVETNDYKRYTAKLQNDFNISNAIKVGYTVTGMHSFSRDIPGGIFHQLYSAYPVLPVYYADGSYGDPADFPLGDGARFNPQAAIDLYNQTTVNNRVTGNLHAELKFARHFVFKSSVGGEFSLGDIQNYQAVYNGSATFLNTVSKLTVTNNRNKNSILENTLTYDNKFNNHSVKVLLGQSAQSYDYTSVTQYGENVPITTDGKYYFALGNNYRITDVDINNTQLPAYPLSTRVASYFGRVNYSFMGKYLLNVSMRADGSSKFSKADRWGYFPSIGGAWIITEEEFMKKSDMLNLLKLRGSWGKIGNASVPGNLSTQIVTTGDNVTAIWNNLPAVGASIATIVPPVIKWESGVGTDIGLEAALLKSRLTLDLDYYNKKTENAIFAIPILSSLGMSGNQLIGNQASYQNRGVEFAIGWKDQIGHDFIYSINANAGFNANKVLSVSTGANPIYQAVGTTGSNNFNTKTVVGQPIGEFFGYKVNGIFQTAAEAAASPQSASAKAGDFKYMDLSGPNGKPDGQVNDFDKTFIGNPNPKCVYGINTSFAYKQIDLAIDFQGVAGVDVYNANMGLRYGSENFTKDFYDHRWHGAGTSNTYPSANIGGAQNYLANSFYVQDGSYFRIRNLQLGYSFSQLISRKLGLSKLRIFADAQNPFNFFRYKGFSPEIGGGPTKAGIDVNVYPLSATYRVGVNVTF